MLFVFAVRQYGSDSGGTVYFTCRTSGSVCTGASAFINLLTDSLPAIAIGMEPADAALLEENQGILLPEY